jgi:hypothetical protein
VLDTTAKLVTINRSEPGRSSNSLAQCGNECEPLPRKTQIPIGTGLETFNLSDLFAGLRGTDRRNYLADPIARVGPHFGSRSQKLHRYQPMKLD